MCICLYVTVVGVKMGVCTYVSICVMQMYLLGVYVYLCVVCVVALDVELVIMVSW